MRNSAKDPFSHLPARRRSQCGFALMDVMAGLAVIAMVAGASLWALSQANRMAATNRNLTAAKAVAQSRIDEALSVSYRPPTTIPSVLATGTTTTNITVVPETPTITGTMATTVAVTDATLNIRRVTVTVNYTYRSKAYSVALTTARAPD